MDKYKLSCTIKKRTFLRKNAYILIHINTADDSHFCKGNTFHSSIAELTQKKNINYGQFASKMDFPRTYIYEWIKENTLPAVDYVLAISKYFKVTPDYLLGRSDYRN